MTPCDGMQVMFGHLLLKGERTGIIVSADVVNFAGSGVAVDFMPEDGPQNPPGKVVFGCKFFPSKPTALPASHWQYCYPIPDTTLVPIPKAAKETVAKRREKIRKFAEACQADAKARWLSTEPPKFVFK